MRSVFADTFYWIALTDPQDAWHDRALSLSRSLGPVRILTTEPVLIELLNFFGDGGPHWRQAALDTVDMIRQSASVEVVPYIQFTTLNEGMVLYASRIDKGYSMTDCLSMQAMRDHGVYEVLTHDEHFVQEGFVVLLP